MRQSTPLKMGVQIQNTGIAPFYYNWTVQLGVKNSNGEIVKTWDTDWRISKVLPGLKPMDFDCNIDNPGLAVGSYDMVMRVVNPLKHGKQFMFADVEQGEDGWLDLGSFQVTRE